MKPAKRKRCQGDDDDEEEEEEEEEEEKDEDEEDEAEEAEEDEEDEDGDEDDEGDDSSGDDGWVPEEILDERWLYDGKNAQRQYFMKWVGKPRPSRHVKRLEW